MISHRYVPAVCLLLLLALVPTIIHSYSTGPTNDTRVADQIPSVLAGFSAMPTERNAGWGRRRFDSDDWVEREYRSPARGLKATLTIVRSYDAKSVYHHPELAIADGISFVGEEIQYLPERPDLPLHVLTPGPGVAAYAAYVLQYDTRFVADPISFQIRTAGELLFSRRKPMTLLFVLAPDEVSRNESVDSFARTLLVSAVDALLEPTR